MSLFNFLGNYYDKFFYLIILIGSFIFLGIYFRRRFKRKSSELEKLRQKVILSFSYLLVMFVILTIIYSLNLYFLFLDSSGSSTFQVNYFNQTNYQNFSSVKFKDPFLYFNQNISNSSDSVQIINFVFITKKNISQILGQNIWIKNKVIGINNISIDEYFRLLYNDVTPVSILYLENMVPNYSYQAKSSSISKREHLRIWSIGSLNDGSKIYLGSISKDNSIDIFYYKHYITPLHEINPNIDASRTYLFNYLKSQNLATNCTLEYLFPNLKDYKNINTDADYYYYTDGKTLVCRI